VDSGKKMLHKPSRRSLFKTSPGWFHYHFFTAFFTLFSEKVQTTLYLEVLFALLLKEVTEYSTKLETLSNGFRACGLYPLYPNALDYSKCL
jgi:hypothetical protein